jgi:pentatricopeptide repeat protein
MAKSRRGPSFQRRPLEATTDARQAGWRAFQANRFDEAIRAWLPLAAQDQQVRTALGEAYLRRALTYFQLDTAADDLRHAAELLPDDARFPFHLGRRAHQHGDRESAVAYYLAALEHEPTFSSAAQLLALARLEQNPQADLAAQPDVPPAGQRFGTPIQSILRGAIPPADDDSPRARFWRGLGRLQAGDPQGATRDLADPRPMPDPALTGLRSYYQGVAAARAGNKAEALRLWRQARAQHAPALMLADNLGALLAEQLGVLAAEGALQEAADLARETVGLPGSAGFDEARLLALDHAAQAAAREGEWERAAELWEAAAAILADSSGGLGSPRPLLHNLALAYEQQQQWIDAASAWRSMLRTRPRKRGAAEAHETADQRWTWVRARIIECYKRANRPDEAVTVFRQMIKEEPSNLDIRLQLSDALVANGQERAAANEVERVLKIDPQHVDALLRRATLLAQDGGFGTLYEATHIMRDLVARQPERADLRRYTAELLLRHGGELSKWGQYAQAYELFVEGEQYDPENYRFPLNQVRMLLAQGRHDTIEPLVERAVVLSRDQPQALSAVLETWVMADNMPQARALLTRIERETALDPHDYIMFGISILLRVTPLPALPSLFGMLGSQPPPPAPPPADTAWTKLAVELFDKACALEPTDPSLPAKIAHDLALPRPDLALRYAEEAARLLPESPESWMMLGLIQGLNDLGREAKATFKRAQQLARKRGNRELARQAHDMSRAAGTPMFRAMVQMSLMTAEMGLDEADLDLLDELDDPFG